MNYGKLFSYNLYSSVNLNPGQIAGFCALCAIQNHVSRALQSSGRILSPEALVVNLRRILITCLLCESELGNFLSFFFPFICCLQE